MREKIEPVEAEAGGPERDCPTGEVVGAERFCHQLTVEGAREVHDRVEWADRA